jgi:RND family efflux transporter MFP subunit
VLKKPKSTARLLLLSWVVVSGFGFYTNAAAAANTKKVSIEPALHHDSDVTHVLPCVVAAPITYRIASHASAELIQLLPVGTSVKKGQLVAQQDDIYLSQQVALIRTDIESARVAKAFAADEFNRASMLGKKGLASSAEMNKFKLQLDSASLKMQRLELELKLTEARHKRLKHFAPFDAQVIAVNSEPGAQLAEGQPILQLMSTQNKQLECKLPVLAYQNVVALKGHRFDFHGKPLQLREVSQQLDSTSDNLILYFDHPAKDRRDILVGYRQEITMAVKADNITKVPTDAIELEGTTYHTWRVRDNGTVERLDVDILGSTEHFYIVQSDIKPGDQLVVRGQQGLNNGQKVELISRDSPPPP